LNSIKYIEGWHWTNLFIKRSMCQHNLSIIENCPIHKIWKAQKITCKCNDTIILWYFGHWLYYLKKISNFHQQKIQKEKFHERKQRIFWNIQKIF
jgi:hypothetical protein